MRVLGPILMSFALTTAAWSAGPGDPAPFAGTYRGDGLVVTLVARGGDLTGSIRMGGQEYPATARASGEGIDGTFVHEGASFAFQATLSGRTLTLTTEGASYSLQAVENPLARRRPQEGVRPPPPPPPAPEKAPPVAPGPRVSGASQTTGSPPPAALSAPAGQPRPAPAASPSGWTRHEDPLGFVVKLPTGWTATTSGGKQVVVRDESSRAFVLAMPFVAGAGETSETWLGRVPELLSDRFPRAVISQCRRVSAEPDESRALVRFLLDGRAARGHILVSIHARSGMCFAVAACSDRFGALKQSMVEMVRSFSFTESGAPARAPTRPLEYVSWEDPRERAFKVEIPRGWRAEGGLLRRHPTDPRACLQLGSPDGKIRIQSGDASIPTFIEPGFSPFFPEGSDYSPGYGLAMKVKGYLTGLQFAKAYVAAAPPGTVSDVVFTGERDRDDLATAINDLLARQNLPVAGRSMSLGEVTFTCTAGGAPCLGYYFAGIERTTASLSGQTFGTWKVAHLLGYVASRDGEPIARDVLQHLIRSTWLSPDWCAMQQGLNANVAKIVNSTNRELSSLIVDGWERRQAPVDEAMRRWSNATLGITDVRDPDTGETWKASAGHNYYWRLESGERVGTGTFTRPDINAALLENLE